MPPHGTWSRYCTGCRCDLCSTACTEYGRARRAAKKAGVPFVVPPHLVVPATPPAVAVPVEDRSGDGAVVRRFSYSVSVDPAVAGRLARVFGGARFAYNAYVAHARAEFAAGRRHPSWVDGCRIVVTEGRQREETAWMRELPVPVLRSAVRDAARAYEGFFASVTGKRSGPRVGRPRFKKRSSRQSATFTRNGFSIRGGWQNTAAGGGRVWVNKVGYIHVGWHRPLPAEPSSMTLIREADGALRATFVVEMAKPAPTTPTRPSRSAGIDLGLTDYAAIVYSDGT